jgi:hypothetical protein
MKKISSLIRRRMLLDMEEKGLSDKEIREKYGIADNRTLRKHLGLAEKEREVRESRIKILSDNQTEHLAEIRTTIGQWKDSLMTPWFGVISLETESHLTGLLEANPLFNCLREHLPFPTLWRDYSSWKEKVENYIDSCKKLLEETRHEAERSRDPEIRKIAADIGSASTIEALALVKPLHEMMTKYKTRAESQLKPLSDEIRILGEKLTDSLQEILLRRDYIVYTCKLCPGQIRPLR